MKGEPIAGGVGRYVHNVYTGCVCYGRAFRRKGQREARRGFIAAMEHSGSEDPFAKFLGIWVLESSDGRGRAAMPVREDFLQQAGVVQGGLIVTLADHALYRAVKSLLAPQESSVTVEFKVNFRSPARDGELIGEGRVVSRGGRIVVGDVDVVDQRGTLIARGIGTCLVRRADRVMLE